VKNSKGEPQLRIEWAELLTRLHRFKQASTALSNVVAPEPSAERIGYFRLKAAISAGLGNLPSAAAEMEKALATAPDDTQLQIATAAAQLNSGNAERAITLLKPIFSSAPDPEPGLLLLQAQLASHNDTEQTLRVLRSVQLPGQDELALREHLAEILIAHNDFSEAANDLRRAAQLNPGNPETYFNLALAQFKSGALQEALLSAQKAKDLRDNEDIQGLLGDIQEAIGDNMGAVKSYQAAAALDPNNEDHQLALALEFIRHRNFEPAKLVLKEATDHIPTSWRMQVALGMIEYFTGTKSAASQILLRAADLAPDPSLALRYLGEMELDESAPADEAAVTRLCSYADKHSNAAREQLYCGALMLHTDYASRDKSRSTDIVRRLNAAATALPKEATPHCELGRAYTWLEDWVPAQEHSEICAKLNPNSAQAHYRLSQIYHHTGQLDRSREEIRLYKEASQRLAQENEQHESTLNTFLYTIQNQATETK
jgi:tetratricopeptide (TPR) repeat protein